MASGRNLLAASLLLLSPDRSYAAKLHEGAREDHVEAFHAYMQRYGRGYEQGSEEYHLRSALFAQRRAAAEEQNSRPGRLWDAAVNALSDRTEEELSQLRGWRGGVAPGGGGAAASGFLQRSGSGTFLSQRARGQPIPQEFMNWTKLSSAKSSDQGSCGSCWAVTSSEVLNMHAEIYNPGKQLTFSAQELVSCVPNPHECGGAGGCEGATVELALHWVQSQGLATENETPYLASNGNCKKPAGQGKGLLQLNGHGGQEDVAAVGVHLSAPDSPAKAFGMVGFERLVENGYEALLRAVSERGPVAISVAANSWASYGTGIFDSCGADVVINHAVALVGYGKDRQRGKRFYLVQNSWGPFWGEGGKIRILMDDSDGEKCGMDKQPLLGTGCKGGPTEVKVCGPCGILYDSVVPHFEKPGSQ